MKTRTRNPQSSRSLTATLAIAFLLLGVVVLLISNALQVVSSIATQQQVVAGKLQLIAHAASQPVSSFFRDKFTLLKMAAGRDNLPARPPAEQQRILDGLLGSDSAFRQLVALNAQDQTTAKASRLLRSASGLPADLLSDELFARVKQGQQYVSSVYIDPETGEPLIFIATPATDAFGDFQGALAAEVNLKFMWDVVDQLQVGETGLAYVVDEQGNLIAFSDTARVLRGENVAQLKPVADFIQHPASARAAEAATYPGIMGATVAGTYVPLESPDWAVVTELPWAEAYQQIIWQGVWSIGITVGMAILAGLLGVFVARRLAGP